MSTSFSAGRGVGEAFSVRGFEGFSVVRTAVLGLLLLGLVGGASAFQSFSTQIDGASETSINSGGSDSGSWYGIRFTPDTDVSLSSVDLANGHESSKMYLFRCSDGNQLATATGNGDIADFGGIKLSGGTSYSIVHERYGAAPSSMPYGEEKIYFDGGVYDSSKSSPCSYASQKDNAYGWHTISYSVNSPPSIDSKSSSPAVWNNTDSPDISVSASDDSQVTGVTATAYKNGNQINSVSRSFSSSSVSTTFTDLFTVDTVGDTYSVDIQVEDDAGATSTQTISQTVQQYNPEFLSSGVTPEPPLIGQSVSYSAEVKDDNKDHLAYTNLTLEYGGSQVVSDEKRTGTTPEWNDVFTPQTGNKWLNASLEVVDDAGAVTTKEINRYLADTAPSFSIVEPVNQLYDSQSLQWSVSTDGGGDSVPGEQYDISVSLDGSSVDSASVTEGESASGSFTAGDGSHTLSVTVTEGDGDSTTNSVNFEVDTQPPEIEIFNPTGDLDRKKNLDLDYLVQDPNLDSSSCKYSKDGGANFSISNCQNTSVTYNTVGEHSLTVYASDSLGHSSQETTLFTTDFENRISLEDSISNAQIQDFEVVFSNGSASVGGSSSDGQFEILTSELPRGDVTMTLEADGYKIRNESFTVGSSFELRNTYSMERASFSLDTFSEKNQKDLNFNFTASNGTTVFSKENVSSFQKEYQDFDSIGFPTGDVSIRVQDVKGEYYQRRYFADITENSVINLRSYLLEKGEAILTNIEVRGSDNENLPNALVNIQRNINSSYRTVSQSRSASDGSVSFYLSPDSQYRLVASHSQYESFTGTFNPANYQYNALIVGLETENNFVDSTEWSRLEYILLPDISTLNASGSYSFNWSVVDPESSISSFGVRVRNGSGAVLDQKGVTGSPSGGTVSLNFSLSNYSFSQGDDLEVTGYFVKDQTEFNYLRNYNVVQRVEAGPYSIKSIMEGFEKGSSSTTQSFLALIFTLALGSGLKSRFNRAGGGLVTLLILGFFTLNGWFSGFFWLLTALALVGIYGRGR